MKSPEQQLHNKTEEGIEEVRTDNVEKTDLSLREIGRERIDKIGAFFSRTKESFRDKIARTGEVISGAVGKAKELGIAGVETVLATPEALMRGVEYGVGAGVKSYETVKDAAVNAKQEVIRVKNEIIQEGKSAITNGVRSVAEAKNATVEFGHRALYRAAERVSRPFVNFQAARLEDTLRLATKRVDERLEKGKATLDDFRELLKMKEQLIGLQAI